MKTEYLIKQLNALKAIEPDPVFLRWSRRAIIQAACEPQKNPGATRTILTYLRQPFIRLSLMGAGITSLALLIATTMQLPKADTAKSIASLNSQNIIQEEKAVAPNQKLTDVSYYKNMSPAINLALNDIIDPGTNWKSGEHVKQIAKRYDREP